MEPTPKAGCPECGGETQPTTWPGGIEVDVCKRWPACGGHRTRVGGAIPVKPLDASGAKTPVEVRPPVAASDTVKVEGRPDAGPRPNAAQGSAESSKPRPAGGGGKPRDQRQAQYPRPTVKTVATNADRDAKRADNEMQKMRRLLGDAEARNAKLAAEVAALREVIVELSQTQRAADKIERAEVAAARARRKRRRRIAGRPLAIGAVLKAFARDLAAGTLRPPRAEPYRGCPDCRSTGRDQAGGRCETCIGHGWLTLDACRALGERSAARPPASRASGRAATSSRPPA